MVFSYKPGLRIQKTLSWGTWQSYWLKSCRSKFRMFEWLLWAIAIKWLDW